MQHIATHSNTLQHIRTNYNTLHQTATHNLKTKNIIFEGLMSFYWAKKEREKGHDEDSSPCNTLQHTATHCNTLQNTATHCNTLQHTATHCNILQHTAAHCNTLQHTANYYITLQHLALPCNRLSLLDPREVPKIIQGIWSCHMARPKCSSVQVWSNHFDSENNRFTNPVFWRAAFGRMADRTARAKCRQNIRHVLSASIAQAFVFKLSRENKFKIRIVYSKWL